MACTDKELQLHAYLDGELDLDASLALEQHLESCKDCAADYARHRELQQALQQEGVRYRLAPVFRKRVERAVGKLEGGATRRWLPRFAWGGALAAALAAALIVPRFIMTESVADEYVEDVTADHVRSLMADHLTDLSSADPAVVKPWFDGKLPYSPAVPDLKAQGFTLLGARLDLMDDMHVAALVYQSGAHAINVFVCPLSDEPLPERLQADEDGYHVVHWRSGKMDYWVVSDLDAAELARFTGLMQTQT